MYGNVVRFCMLVAVCQFFSIIDQMRMFWSFQVEVLDYGLRTAVGSFGIALAPLVIYIISLVINRGFIMLYEIVIVVLF